MTSRSNLNKLYSKYLINHLINIMIIDKMRSQQISN